MPPKKAKGSSTKKANSNKKDGDAPAAATATRATRSTRASKKAEIVAEEASVTDVPDIAGVVEEREDEDIAIDATEPPRNDELEKQRLAERPAEARDTAEEAPSMQVDQTIPTQTTDTGIAAQLDPFALNNVQTGDNDDKAEGPSSSATAALTKEERLDKLNALRKRMTDSASANRREVVAAQNEHRKTISESKRLERKRRQAEAMGEKLDAMETGEDLERKRNWEYSLEDNERWNKKQATKDRRMDKGFASYDDSARRKYKKDVYALKPDLNGYRAQRNAALGLIDTDEASTSTDLIHGSSSSSQLVPGADQLYRDASSFVYADHKPSDEAIDRVISQINTDIDKRAKRSRVRDEKDEDVTYINDRNKVFNRKLERFYNSYTKDISDNFERGTAL